MTFNPEWAPSPELLAAYFDGEFEGRDDLAGLRRRVENWLADHPQAAADLAGYRRLRQLWQETTPPEPNLGTWSNLMAHLEVCRPESVWRQPRSRSLLPRAVLLGLVASVLILVFAQQRPSPDDEPFPVATEQEVVILHIEGSDTSSLVVGQLPLQGALELAGPGEVTLTSAQPAEGDNMVPEFQAGAQGRPIIWVRAESEED
jgi:anti-sigma factor RsiW